MTLERDSLLLNRYRIVEILGQGGMGSVYRAIDENLGVEVALKENLFTTEEYNRQFRREATILATMRHPNLPRVSDHFEVESQGQYLVMDYIEGEDLRQRMDRTGILPDEEVIVIGAAICDALFYLHTRESAILHRDIKPGNIKINPDGSIYLVDFGLAKIVRGSEITTTGARAMTPGYSSPEQYGTSRTDARSDIYSLGATLYAALTGTIPEDGLARAMEQTDLTPIRKRNPKVSRKLANVIEKALEIHPDDRYQSGEEFKQALLNASTATRRRVEEGELTIPPPPEEYLAAIAQGKVSDPQSISKPAVEMSGESMTRMRRRQREERGRRFRGFLTTLIVIVLLGGGGYLSYLFTDGFSNNPFALALALTDTPTPTITVTETLEPTDTLMPTETPTDIPTPTVANTTDPAAGEVPTETATSLPTPTSTSTSTPTPTGTITEIPEPVATAFGGGRGQIAFASDRSGQNQIWIMDADGSNARQITDISQNGACQPEWSPDGTQIVFISPCQGANQQLNLTSRLYTINVDGTGIKPLSTEQGSSYPAWSPDGNYILFTVDYDVNRAQIFRYDLRDDTIQLMTANEKRNINPTWFPDGKQILFTSSVGNGLRLYTMPNVPGAEPELFDRSINKENFYADLSPDSVTVAFSQRPSGGTVLNLVTLWVDVPRTTSEYYEERLASDEIVPEVEPDWSPDGQWIAFESWPDGENHDIYIIRENGEDRTRITTQTGNDFDPAWRPAGGQ
ncbi:MAG: serine/threonine-protein kinase [Anaerolineales bacterium]|nr:serine/threonine-protein kinase [Anaerolineales bacterium]